MMLYRLALSIHVVTAILGLGRVVAIAVIASRDEPAGAGTWNTLQQLVKGLTWSLPIMLLSGALLEYASGGAYHGAWWFRLSVLALFVLGALSGAMRRALRKRESTGDERTLGLVARHARIMCAVTAAAAVLMEVKPW
ncbi:hypothetical protein LVJ94_32680 [Pendulispora rubella]|uniref:DUF2269 family protein n=1 Tax=Pendulispora rubella TaxID=2741070 RepID=A0ABZ2KXC2_9BACT